MVALENIDLAINERKLYGNNSPIKRPMERRATGNKDQLTEEYEGRAQAESVLKSHRWLQRQILDKTPRGEHFSSSPFIHKYLSHHYIL